MNAMVSAEGPAISDLLTDCFGTHVGARAQQITVIIVGVAIRSTATGTGADEGRGN